MDGQAVSKDTISERLATLAGAIGALESAIAATDKALQATSAEELASAISTQTLAADRTLQLKQKLQQNLLSGTDAKTQPLLREQLLSHPNATQLLPQLEQIERRLKKGQDSLTQQALVVNKMQGVNRQLLGVLTQIDEQGYNQQGEHSESTSARTIAQA